MTYDEAERLAEAERRIARLERTVLSRLRQVEASEATIFDLAAERAKRRPCACNRSGPTA